MFEEQNNEKEKRNLMGFIATLVFMVACIFTMLVFHYVIGPNKAHRDATGTAPTGSSTVVNSITTKVGTYKLDWDDEGYADINGGVTRLPNYVFSSLVDATQVTHAVSADELKTKFQTTIWPLGDKLSAVMGLGKADFQSSSGYNTLTYRKNPTTSTSEELRYMCDTSYITLSYTKQIDTSAYSPDTLKSILSDGADYVGVKLDSADLSSNINELLSRKLKDQYDAASLTYRDSQSKSDVYIEHTTDSIGDDKRVDVMVFTFERTSPTVKLN